ncbi:MAG: cytochrome c3 family protein [Blastocatellia bacterium]
MKIFCKFCFVLLACSLLIAVRGAQEPLPGPVQPIPYSHKTHTGKLKLDCKSCHPSPDPGEKMTIPQADTCMECHESIKTDSAEIQKLAGYVKEKREIKWRRVYEIPSYVYFSHRSHMAVKDASCADCHGQVREREQIYKEGNISMGACMNCHQAKGASTDCMFCHEKVN